MRVAVTGASGLVGVNLVRALVERGDTVRALVHRDRRGLDPVELATGDVLDSASLSAAFDGAEVVYHLAVAIGIRGEDDTMRRVNVEGTRNVAEAARLVGARLVHMSSMVAFDIDTAGPADESSDRPGLKHPAYNRSKAAGESVVRDAIDSGLDAVIVNPTAVLGPGHHQPSMLNDILLRLYSRRLFALVAGGVDCVDVRDVAAGAIAAGQRGRTGHNYVLSGTWLSIRDLAGLAAEVSGIRVPRLSVPLWLAHASVPAAQAWSRVRGVEPLYTHDALRSLRMSSEISHAKATSELGYRPRPLRDTLSDAYAWFRETGLLT